MTKFTGINNAKAEMEAYDSGYNREMLRRQDMARKKAGDYIADGDLSGASKAYAGVGLNEEALKLRDTYRTETRQASAATALSRMIPQRSASGGPASQQLQSSPSYGNVVQSEALAEPTYTDSRPDAKSQLMSSQAPSPRASQELDEDVPISSYSAFDMRRLTGGGIDSQSLFDAAQAMLADLNNADYEKALELVNAGIERQGIEHDLNLANEKSIVEHYVKTFNSYSPEERQEFADMVRTDKQLLASAPNEVLEALKTNTPDDDLQAMRKWAAAYGVSADLMFGDDQYEKDEERRRDEMRFDTDEDLRSLRLNNAEDARYEPGGDKYVPDDEDQDGEGGYKLTPDDNIYGVNPLPDFDGSSLFSRRVANAPASVQKSREDAYQDVVAEVNAMAAAEFGKMEIGMQYVDLIEKYDLWDALGSKPANTIARSLGITDPDAIAALGTLQQELVRYERQSTKGIFTDADAEGALRLGPSVLQSGETIRAMMYAQIKKANSYADRADFVEEYSTRIAGVDRVREAENIWLRWQRDNPALIIDNNKVVENPEYQTFPEWYKRYEANRTKSDQYLVNSFNSADSVGSGFTDMRDF